MADGQTLAGGTSVPGTRMGRTAEGRPIVVNEEGGLSTEQSITVDDPRIKGRSIVIPTMFDGKKVSDEDALLHVMEAGFKDPETGREFDSFKTREAADAFARQRSDALDQDPNVRSAFERLRAQKQPGADDLSSQYQAQRQETEAEAAIEAMRGRVQSRQQPGAAPGGGEAGGRAEATAQAPRTDESGASATAADIGIGAIEAPRAVAVGAIDAAIELSDNLTDIGAGLTALLPEGTAGKDTPIEDLAPDQVMEVIELVRGKLVEGIKGATPEDPKSNTGQMVKGIAQFLVGFGPALKATKALKLGLPGRPGEVLEATIAGSLADVAVIDEQEANLADLWQEMDLPENVLTDFLATEEDDSVAFGKVKQAVNGAVGGLAADGLVAAIRGIKNIKISRKSEGAQARDDALTADVSEGSQVRDRDFMILGDPNEPLIVRGERATALATVREGLERTDPGVPDDVAAKGVARGATGEGEQIFINFARIDTADDVKTVMRDLTESFADDIDKARRGVVTNKQTLYEAGQVDNVFERLANRRVGDPLGAAETTAARQLWTSSAEQLQDVAALAAREPSEANLFNFRKMLAIHHTIQEQVISARAETARALQAWSIPAGSTREQTRALQNLVTSAGGLEVNQELAKRIALLRGHPEEMVEVARGTVFARTRDAVLQGWINGLLSGPKTHMVNVMSNASVVFLTMGERAVAARISRLLGDQNGVEIGEATQQWFGAVEGTKEALRLNAKSLRILAQATGKAALGNPTGGRQLLSENAEEFGTAFRAFVTGQAGFGLGKIDLPRANAISSEAFNISNSSYMGRFVDVLGTMSTIPGRALTAGDEIFKTIGYRMEVKAQAARQAKQEVQSGQIPASRLKERINEISNDPPENIRLEAVDAALYQTFTNEPGNFTKWVQAGVNKIPVLRVITPFVRTPGNLIRFTMDRTPMAPLFKQFRADVAAGGVRRDIALARMGTGTAIMLASADAAMNGLITGGGPVNPGERQALMRTGWQPYSVKINDFPGEGGRDRFFSYRRLDPVGMSLGMAADLVEFTMHTDWTDEDMVDLETAAVAIAGAIGSNAMSKTYLTGASEFFEAMSDPTRYSERYFRGLAASVVPTGVGEVARFMDPNLRAANTMLEAMQAKIPHASGGLLARHDLWGREIVRESGLGQVYDAFSPIYSRVLDPEPVDSELLRLESFPRMPARKVSFGGVTVDLQRRPAVYQRYVQLAGNELKHPAWGVGLKDLLNAVITGKHPLSPVYQFGSDGPDGGKADFIRDKVIEYRGLARDQLLEEFPELRGVVTEKQRERQEQKLPLVR